MTTGKEKANKRPSLWVATVAVLLLSAIWASPAISDDGAKNLAGLIGARLSDDALQLSSGQGMHNSVEAAPNDTSILDVILWDESHRPPPPIPTSGGTTSLSSTVNGSPY
ncbi:MAG: hypothetical protein HQ511_03745 [Rhodospirillales bacterium]|nr:hypothetical protein [Rhodospirillales bacterium]